MGSASDFVGLGWVCNLDGDERGSVSGGANILEVAGPCDFAGELTIDARHPLSDASKVIQFLARGLVGEIGEGGIVFLLCFEERGFG